MKHNMFEPFNIHPGDSRKKKSGELVIRPAEIMDAEILGNIAADREGGDPSEYITGFLRAIDHEENNRRHLILVAESAHGVIGFGKAQYLFEGHGPDHATAPEGWYLTGVVVDPRFRRLGAGTRLTDERLRWISERSSCVFYVANVKNPVSLALHKRYGFREIARGPALAGVEFTGGEGILFRLDFSANR